MRKGDKRTGMFLAALGLAGCSAAATSSDGENVESTGQAATSTCAITPLVGQSLFLANNVATFGHAGPVNTPNPFGKALLRSSSFSFLNVLKQVVISGGADVSGAGGAEAAGDILNRATTQSCAGCHQISTGTKLGGGLTWPDSNGFVQVEETTGQQSIALANFFLPFRAKVLTKFIDKHCAGTGAGADEVVAGETVAGTDTGGAN